MSNMSKIRLYIRNGFVYNEENTIIAVLTDDATKQEEKLIELGSEAAPALQEFVDNIDSGKFKPKSVYNTFKAILEKYS